MLLVGSIIGVGVMDDVASSASASVSDAGGGTGEATLATGRQSNAC